MNENALYITLEQIPDGVRIRENYSSRFVSCLQQDCMQESLMILQGLVGVIDLKYSWPEKNSRFTRTGEFCACFSVDTLQIWSEFG